MGDKFLVTGENTYNEFVVRSMSGDTLHYLPKSEYVLCDPPEVWNDVTEKCSWNDRKNLFVNGGSICFPNYRVRKVRLFAERGSIVNGDLSDDDFVPQWAFIIEQKQL